MGDIERIIWDGALLACIVRAETVVEETTFLTPPEYNFQVGFVVRQAGGQIAPHEHLPVERRVVGTFEVLVVRQGSCEVDFFSREHKRVATRRLERGDVILIAEGGHSFRMLEDTVFLEIKQGPYGGEEERERF